MHGLRPADVFPCSRTTSSIVMRIYLHRPQSRDYRTTLCSICALLRITAVPWLADRT